MSTYERMVERIETATDALERLRSEVEERAESELIEEPPEPMDVGTASAAVIALSEVFEVVKALAEEGQPLDLPTEPLPLADAALVTILANAEIARRGMRADVEWVVERMEALR